MQNIKMVDLKNQYLKIKSEVDFAIKEVIDSSAFINGPAVLNFQKNLEKYLNTKHVITCGNGTDALQIALMALDFQPDDEIITPSFTFAATVEVISLLKLKPVLVDVDKNTFNICVESLKKAITNKTKAIIPVHLYGQCANMNEIIEIAEKNNIIVIEDACQAVGSNYIFKNGLSKKAGTLGKIGCASFFPSKNLGCFGDGGAIFTDDDTLANKIRSIANHGMPVKYYHEYIGINSRLDSIQAAILDIKLKYLDEYNLIRNYVAELYNQAFKNCKNIITPYVADYSTHIYHQYTLILKNVDRKKFTEHLSSMGIPTMIYYPIPMHLQNAYKYLGYSEGTFPVSEMLSKSVVSLPIHTEMDSEQISYIIRCVKEFTEK